MDHKISNLVAEHLDNLGIGYNMVEHEPALTMEDLAAVDRELGVPHAKNLFLCNRKKTEFYLLLMEGDKPFRTAELSRQIGERLSFARPEYMEQYLRTKPGALSPMGLIFDFQRQVKLIVDKDLRKHDKLCFHPCVNDASLVMLADDFWNVFLRSTGHNPFWADLTGDA